MKGLSKKFRRRGHEHTWHNISHSGLRREFLFFKISLFSSCALSSPIEVLNLVAALINFSNKSWRKPNKSEIFIIGR